MPLMRQTSKRLTAHFHSFEALSQPTPASNSDGPAVQRDKGTGSVLSGRDMLAGGTWLGINRTTGRIALITNITEPPATYASSRGTLVSSFLGDPSAECTDETGILEKSILLYIPSFSIVGVQGQLTNSSFRAYGMGYGQIGQ
ncbi:hypothetical protein EDB86DRAFT_564833 [Lactarius hatsudake]|nr:hypothetical protein EDB86DRAFT_564833 [Lactarius hatsudake]